METNTNKFIVTTPTETKGHVIVKFASKSEPMDCFVREIIYKLRDHAVAYTIENPAFGSDLFASTAIEGMYASIECYRDGIALPTREFGNREILTQFLGYGKMIDERGCDAAHAWTFADGTAKLVDLVERFADTPIKMVYNEKYSAYWVEHNDEIADKFSNNRDFVMAYNDTTYVDENGKEAIHKATLKKLLLTDEQKNLIAQFNDVMSKMKESGIDLMLKDDVIFAVNGSEVADYDWEGYDELTRMFLHPSCKTEAAITRYICDGDELYVKFK